MTELKIGDTQSAYLRTRVCKRCDTEIDGTLCSYQCQHDGELRRPKGTVVRRSWKRVDTLIEQEDE
jgi:hypothetical protein